MGNPLPRSKLKPLRLWASFLLDVLYRQSDNSPSVPILEVLVVQNTIALINELQQGGGLGVVGFDLLQQDQQLLTQALVIMGLGGPHVGVHSVHQSVQNRKSRVSNVSAFVAEEFTDVFIELCIFFFRGVFQSLFDCGLKCVEN